MKECLLSTNGMIRFSFPDLLRTGWVRRGGGSGVKVLKFSQI